MGATITTPCNIDPLWIACESRQDTETELILESEIARWRLSDGNRLSSIRRREKNTDSFGTASVARNEKRFFEIATSIRRGEKLAARSMSSTNGSQIAV